MSTLPCSCQCRHDLGWHQAAERTVDDPRFDDHPDTALSSAPLVLEDSAAPTGTAPAVLISGEAHSPAATRRFVAQLLDDLDTAEEAAGVAAGSAHSADRNSPA